ncbi:PAS domain-containing protein [Streptomyces sp. NPDC047009]|uniref:PAS domain-containing protein n=1 Tax=unclassified Streptomyces TaxID=2593676 RepID=UPI00340EBAE3
MTLGSEVNGLGMSGTAFALLDELGTVVGWTQAAQRLVGHGAGDIMGRSAALVVPSFEAAATTSGFVERCLAENGRPGATSVRHRGGHLIDISLRITALRGQDPAEVVHILPGHMRLQPSTPPWSRPPQPTCVRTTATCVRRTAR